MENITLYQLALSRIKGIGPAQTKNLIRHFGDASSIFHADRKALERTGLRTHLIDAILKFPDKSRLEQELRHLKRLGARTLFFTDPDYPRRLLSLPDVPTLLFYQGGADLNSARVVAIAGTRKPSPYGIQSTAQIIRDLASPDLLVLSGLALGIDTIAHKTALKCHIPTVGVLGHGLDFIYPSLNRSLFHAMRHNGGLVTSFLHEIKADTYTFPMRNNLVAALCDALIVIESSPDGGSMSAADAAQKLQRKVFALPGRITDANSGGCLQLIHEKRAQLFLSASQFRAAMGWDWPAGHQAHQPALPFTAPPRSATEEYTADLTQAAPEDYTADLAQAAPEESTPALELSAPQEFAPNFTSQPQPAPLPPDPDDPRKALETQLVALLAEQQPLSLDDFIKLTHQSISSISVALLKLEIRGAIRPLPGRRYRLAG